MAMNSIQVENKMVQTTLKYRAVNLNMQIARYVLTKIFFIQFSSHNYLYAS